jgi:hypothetical protein
MKHKNIFKIFDRLEIYNEIHMLKMIHTLQYNFLYIIERSSKLVTLNIERFRDKYIKLGTN